MARGPEPLFLPDYTSSPPLALACYFCACPKVIDFASQKFRTTSDFIQMGKSSNETEPGSARQEC